MCSSCFIPEQVAGDLENPVPVKLRHPIPLIEQTQLVDLNLNQCHASIGAYVSVAACGGRQRGWQKYLVSITGRRMCVADGPGATRHQVEPQCNLAADRRQRWADGHP